MRLIAALRGYGDEPWILSWVLLVLATYVVTLEVQESEPLAFCAGSIVVELSYQAYLSVDSHLQVNSWASSDKTEVSFA